MTMPEIINVIDRINGRLDMTVSSALLVGA